MTRDTVSDGKRIGQLLASEIHGHERGHLGELAVVDADTDAEPTEDGTFAYALALEGDGDRIASVALQPQRIRLEFETGVETARSAAEGVGLPTELKRDDPGPTVVFVENGADVKTVLGVVRAVVEERLETGE